MKYVLSGTGFSLVFVLSVTAMAEGFQPAVHGGDGFRESGLPVSTVAAALKMPDDTAVVLEGKIEKRLEKENYLFSTVRVR